ncbi:Uncharacterised protein [Chlamydia trachomatis]|nr:Uncharacterised protein [Chlamydia trachomatis]CRH86069.1 Uncharacterised protein [Chlamydia trachomatis]
MLRVQQLASVAYPVPVEDVKQDKELQMLFDADAT